MKKVLMLIISSILLCACNNKNYDDVIKKFEKSIIDSSNYTLKGNMEILNNEEVFTYDVCVNYLKGDYYKVSLTNKNNDHEQIILKNTDGVYVITPSLNKSFKFQSDWPNTGSQSYILSSLLKDIKKSDERKVELVNNKYVISSKADYPNNSNLTKQKITINKNMKLEKVEVFNDKGISEIKLNITSLDLKSNNKKSIFELNNIDKLTETLKETSELEEVLYPMYIPLGTKYSKEEKIKNDKTERVILTYTGEKPFIMIEETGALPDDIEVTAVNGELVSYGNILGVMTDTSLNWSSNGTEYYLISSNMNKEELLKIASSTSSVAVSLQK